MGAVCPVPAWASEARARAWGTQRRRLWSGREAWRVQVGSAPPGGARATPHAHRRHSSRPIHCRSARAQPCAAARRGAVLCVWDSLRSIPRDCCRARAPRTSDAPSGHGVPKSACSAGTSTTAAVVTRNRCSPQHSGAECGTAHDTRCCGPFEDSGASRGHPTSWPTCTRSRSRAQPAHSAGASRDRDAVWSDGHSGEANLPHRCDFYRTGINDPHSQENVDT